MNHVHKGEQAIQKEIDKDKTIGSKESKLIHALLKGRTRANRNKQEAIQNES